MVNQSGTAKAETDRTTNPAQAGWITEASNHANEHSQRGPPAENHEGSKDAIGKTQKGRASQQGPAKAGTDRLTIPEVMQGTTTRFTSPR